MIGSSPRLRGTASPSNHHRSESRFIPAPAGNRPSRSRPAMASPVHPRACGEQWRAPPTFARSAGSSPRLRGTGASGDRAGLLRRFIPAPAGNRYTRPGAWDRLTVHPRACGEQTWTGKVTCGECGSSPRLRGTEIVAFPLPLSGRFIPAPAGNSTCRQSGYSPVRFRFIPAPAGNRRQSCRFRWLPPVHPRACGEQLLESTGKPLYHGSSPRLRGTGLFTILS